MCARGRVVHRAAAAVSYLSLVCIVLLFCVNGSALADAKPDLGSLSPTDITIDTQSLTSFRRARPGDVQFGQLEFLGGLVLTAPDSKYFGGWSGLAMNDDGRDFTAISDSGVWLIATLEYDGRAPSAVKNARLGPLLAVDGQPLKRNRDRDAEAISLINGTVRNGTVLIAFEQNSRVARYDVSDGALSRALGVLEKPSKSANMRRNNGFEAMTVMRGGPYKGRPVAISERLYNASRNHTGWIWTPSAVKPFYVSNIGDFDVTDIASSDDGTLFVLERRFRWIEGVKMRIRRIAPGELQPGRTISGETLLEADMGYEIDNMEGLAAIRGADGRVILTVLSDDNFNRILQRTLLLQFVVTAPDATKTRP